MSSRMGDDVPNARVMKRSLKPCKEFGCGKLTREAYCITHEGKAEEEAAVKRREYNRLIRPAYITRFYGGGDWVRLRAVAMVRDNHLCQRCLKSNRLQAAHVVHHLIEVRDDWNKRLDLNNLESLCHTCHNQHHKS